MLCDHCKKNEATLHMTNIINNKKTEKHLCSQCAQLEKYNYGSNNIFDVLQNDFFQKMVYPDYGSVFLEEEKCPQCGMTYARFNEQGKFGCAHCYNHFHDRVYPLIKGLQGTTQYEGRVPKRAQGHLRKRAEVNQLRKELAEAIRTEKFEQAAQLRDRIKHLEETLDA